MEGFLNESFFEEWSGMAIGLQVEEILVKEKETDYQEVSVFKRYGHRVPGIVLPSLTSKTFGNVLVIDEVIQCTERDEFPYHEMIAHLPLFCHPNPTKVCIHIPFND